MKGLVGGGPLLVGDLGPGPPGPALKSGPGLCRCDDQNGDVALAALITFRPEQRFELPVARERTWEEEKIKFTVHSTLYDTSCFPTASSELFRWLDTASKSLLQVSALCNECVIFYCSPYDNPSLPGSDLRAGRCARLF